MAIPSGPGIPHQSQTTRVGSAKYEERREEFNKLLKELEGYEKTPDPTHNKRVTEILGQLKTEFNVDVTRGTILVKGEPHKVEVLAGSTWVKARELPSYAERAKVLFAHVDLFTEGLQSTKDKEGKVYKEGRGQFQWTQEANEGKLVKGTITAGNAELVPTWAGRFRQILTLGQQSALMPGKKATTELVRDEAFLNDKVQEIVESVHDLGIGLLGVKSQSERLDDLAIAVAAAFIDTAAPLLEGALNITKADPLIKGAHQALQYLQDHKLSHALIQRHGGKDPSTSAEAYQLLRGIVNDTRADMKDKVEAKRALQEALKPLVKTLAQDPFWHVSTTVYDLTKIDETASGDKLAGAFDAAADKEAARQQELFAKPAALALAKWAQKNKDLLEKFPVPEGTSQTPLLQALKDFVAAAEEPAIVDHFKEALKCLDSESWPMKCSTLNQKGERVIDEPALQDFIHEALIKDIPLGKPIVERPLSEPESPLSTLPKAAARAAPAAQPVIPKKALTETELSRLAPTGSYKEEIKEAVKNWFTVWAKSYKSKVAEPLKKVEDDFGTALLQIGLNSSINAEEDLKTIIRRLSSSTALIKPADISSFLDVMLPQGPHRVPPAPAAISSTPTSTGHREGNLLNLEEERATEPGSPSILSSRDEVPRLPSEATPARSPAETIQEEITPDYRTSIDTSIKNWYDPINKPLTSSSDSKRSLENALYNIILGLSLDSQTTLDTIIRRVSEPGKLIRPEDLPKVLDRKLAEERAAANLPLNQIRTAPRTISTMPTRDSEVSRAFPREEELASQPAALAEAAPASVADGGSVDAAGPSSIAATGDKEHLLRLIRSLSSQDLAALQGSNATPVAENIVKLAADNTNAEALKDLEERGFQGIYASLNEWKQKRDAELSRPEGGSPASEREEGPLAATPSLPSALSPPRERRFSSASGTTFNTNTTADFPDIGAASVPPSSPRSRASSIAGGEEDGRPINTNTDSDTEAPPPGKKKVTSEKPPLTAEVRPSVIDAARRGPIGVSHAAAPKGKGRSNSLSSPSAGQQRLGDRRERTGSLDLGKPSSLPEAKSLLQKKSSVPPSPKVAQRLFTPPSDTDKLSSVDTAPVDTAPVEADLQAAAHGIVETWVDKYHVAIEEAFQESTDPIGHALYQLSQGEGDKKALMDVILQGQHLTADNLKGLQETFDEILLQGFRALPQEAVEAIAIADDDKLAKVKRDLLSMILREKVAVISAFEDAEEGTPKYLLREIARGSVDTPALLEQLVAGSDESISKETLENFFYGELFSALSEKVFYAPHLQERHVPSSKALRGEIPAELPPEAPVEERREAATPVLPKTVATASETVPKEATPEEKATAQIQKFLQEHIADLALTRAEPGDMLGAYVQAYYKPPSSLATSLISDLAEAGFTPSDPNLFKTFVDSFITQAFQHPNELSSLTEAFMTGLQATGFTPTDPVSFKMVVTSYLEEAANHVPSTSLIVNQLKSEGIVTPEAIEKRLKNLLPQTSTKEMATLQIQKFLQEHKADLGLAKAKSGDLVDVYIHTASKPLAYLATSLISDLAEAGFTPSDPNLFKTFVDSFIDQAFQHPNELSSLTETFMTGLQETGFTPEDPVSFKTLVAAYLEEAAHYLPATSLISLIVNQLKSEGIVTPEAIEERLKRLLPTHTS